MTIMFEPADATRDHASLTELNIQYLAWLDANIQRDFGPFMTSAHRLYEAEGFRDRDAYAGAEVPAAVHHNWRFMERPLGSIARAG